MNDDLTRLLERARTENRREQAISFAYGNIRLSNPALTREMVGRAYDRLYAHGSNPTGAGLARAVAGGYPRDEG